MQSPAVVLIPFDWVPAGVRVVSSQRTDARSRPPEHRRGQSGRMIAGAPNPGRSRHGCLSGDPGPGRVLCSRKRGQRPRGGHLAHASDDDHHGAGTVHHDNDRHPEAAGRPAKGGSRPGSRAQRRGHDSGAGEPSAVCGRAVLWRVDVVDDQAQRREPHRNGPGPGSRTRIQGPTWTGRATLCLRVLTSPYPRIRPSGAQPGLGRCWTPPSPTRGR